MLNSICRTIIEALFVLKERCKMKTKKFLSVLLSFVIICCFMSPAFAADADLEINEINYKYYGELTEGRTEVCEDVWIIEDVYVYYTFNVSADGYYLFSYGTPHTDMNAYIADPNSGGYEPAHEETLYDYYLTTKIYYLTEGEYNFLIDIYYSGTDVGVTSEFLGEEITGITFNYDQLLDYDLYWWESQKECTFESYADATLTFSSGKTHVFSDGLLEGTAYDSPVDRKNNVCIDFLNQKIDSSVTVYPVSHFISDAEISNVDNYTKNTLKYYNRLEKTYPYGETITVTFTDGTKQNLEYTSFQEYVTLSNGQDYPLEIYYDTDYDILSRQTYQLEICLGYNCVIKEYEVNSPKASFVDNIKSFREDNGPCLNEMFKSLGPMLGSIGNKEEFMLHLETIVLNFLQIYINCYDFFIYYSTFSFI